MSIAFNPRRMVSRIYNAACISTHFLFHCSYSLLRRETRVQENGVTVSSI